jgi:cytoskeletal protein CcmA (bactofilin family)
MIKISNIKGTLVFSFVVSVLLVSSVTLAEASSVVRSGEVVSLAEDQTVEGDFYGAAGTINLSGNVTEDVVLFGGQITVNGKVEANAFLVGGSVDVHGEIGDDLRIISGEVKIAEPVAGDLVVVGGSVTILSTASIAGDVLVYAGEVTIEGPVGGDVLGAVDQLRIDSAVAGKVDVRATNLTLGSEANIQGSVVYVSANLATQAQESTVVGEMVRNDPIITKEESFTWSWIVPSLMLLFSSLIWYLLSRKTLNIVTERSVKDIPKHFLVGFVTLFTVPIACAILFVSMIGTFVALPLLFGYLLFVSLAVIGLIPVLGRYMMMAFSNSQSRVTPMSLIIGASGFGLLSMLPIVGEIVIIMLVVVIIGTVIDALVVRAEYK